MAKTNLQDFTLLITYCTSTCAQRLYNMSFSLRSFLKEGAWSCLSLVSSTTLYTVTIWYIWRLAMNTKSWGAQPGRNKTIAQEMQLILNTDTPVLIRWVETRVKVTPGRRHEPLSPYGRRILGRFGGLWWGQFGHVQSEVAMSTQDLLDLQVGTISIYLRPWEQMNSWREDT